MSGINQYKSDKPHENIPLTNLIKCHQGQRKKCDYMLIDDACAAVSRFFQINNESKLSQALDSLSFFFEYQNIVRVPQSFQKLDIMKILMTIIINEKQQFNPTIIANSISSIKYIFRSSQMCSNYLSEDIIAIICRVISNWDKIFSFDTDKRESDLICIGDLIQIINSFILYDHSLLTSINNNLSIQFILCAAMSLPFQNNYVLVCFASYFYIFFDTADCQLLNSNLDASTLFLKFCASCYQSEFKPTYQYNLYSLSEIVHKLEQNFSVDQFIELELNQFVNSAILEDDNDILFQAIRVISYFYSPYENKKSTESDSSYKISSFSKESAVPNDCFLHFPKELFDIESLVVLPKLRDNISDDIRTYSVIVLKTVFQYNYEYMTLFFQYEMPYFFISQFMLKRFDMKKAICSLFLYIIEVISDQFIIEMIEQGLFRMFIDFLQTESLNFEIFCGIKLILDRLQDSEKYDFFIVLLQDETFQDILSEAVSGEDQKCAEIASILKKMTFIEDVE